MKDKVENALRKLGIHNYIVIMERCGKLSRPMPKFATGRIHKQPPLNKGRSTFYIIENGRERLLGDMLSDLKYSDSLKTLTSLLKNTLNQLILKEEKKPRIRKAKKSISKKK